MQTIKLLWQSLRPKQRIKNTIIFIPLVFAWLFFEPHLLLKTTLWFVLFCLFVWTSYILNDIKDIPYDQQHPKKKHRPLASGKLNKKVALYTSIILLILSLTSLFFLNLHAWIIGIIYIVNTTIYTNCTKKIAILDVFSISLGFVLRWVLWAILIDVQISPWLLVVLFFGSLLLWYLKRYQERHLTTNTRENIRDYDPNFLQHLINSLITTVIVAYAFYSFNSTQSNTMLLSLPLVVYILYRFLYIVTVKKEYEKNIDSLLYSDSHIKISLLLYVVVVFCIIYIWW